MDNRRYISAPAHNLCPIAENTYFLDDLAGKDDPLAELSRRQREIFHLMAIAVPNTEIAKKLFLSPRTVEVHRAFIVRKLKLRSNMELIRFALKYKLAEY